MGDRRVLHLPLKSEWYDMIESGEKREEYREFKEYYISRLVEMRNRLMGQDIYTKLTPHLVRYYAMNKGHFITDLLSGTLRLKDYDEVRFSRGYTNRTMTYEVLGLRFDFGRVDWGAPAYEMCFIVDLGEVL